MANKRILRESFSGVRARYGPDATDEERWASYRRQGLHPCPRCGLYVRDSVCAACGRALDAEAARRWQAERARQRRAS